MVKKELCLDIGEDEDPIRYVEVETAIIEKPRFKRAGIWSLDAAFSQLPQCVLKSCGSFPNIDYSRVRELIVHLEAEVPHALEDKEYLLTTNAAQDRLNPIKRNGLVGQIANTKAFGRLMKIAQLGLARDYPLPNWHSRGEHSLCLTVNSIKSLQAMEDADPAQLEERLRDDFTDETFYNHAMDRTAVFDLATDLTVCATTMHDLRTPAGGDTFKYLLNIREEDELERFLFGNYIASDYESEELLAILAERGISENHLRFVTRCVKGESSSLVGDLLSPARGDKLDHDRISYTLLDCEQAGMFWQELPTNLLPKTGSKLQEKMLYASLSSAIGTLRGDSDAVVGGFPIVDPNNGKKYFPPHVNMIDPTTDYCLKDKKLVCANPEKLAWVAAFRIWMNGLHYAGPKMLGLETELQRKLGDLMRKGIGMDLLTREKLLQFTDDQLYQELIALGDPGLSKIIHNNTRTTVGHTSFYGYATNETQIVPEPYASYPLKIKPGLDSLVKHEGKVTTLGEYVLQNPDHTANRFILSGIQQFKEMNVVIYKKPDDGDKFISLPGFIG